jgi:hypothetical protein
MRHNPRLSTFEALLGNALAAARQARKDKRRKRLQKRHTLKTWKEY